MKMKFFLAFLALTPGFATLSAQTTYDEWASASGLSGASAHPNANPDGDRYVNALEYTFGTDPVAPTNPAETSPSLEVDGKSARFSYRIGKDSRSNVSLRVLQSTDLKNWKPLTAKPEVIGETATHLSITHTVSPNKEVFYVLEATVESLTSGATVVTVGTNIGQGYWEGLPVVNQADILTQPPANGVDPNNPNNLVPNTSKYPVAAGAGQGAFTEFLKADYESKPGGRPPLRSWLGWFLWGNGTPPPGVNPGIFNTEAGYGSYNGTTWDYFNFQWPKEGGKGNGTWNPVRIDQQPLFLTPLNLAYNWAPGLFGYVSQPFLQMPPEFKGFFYWKNKRIVRGVNIGGTNPYTYQYGDKITSTAIPEAWRQAWLYVSMRPLETTVIVPGNLPPDDLLKPGEYNKLPDGSNDPFPYPMWDQTRPASDQTPFAILADKIGDSNADLIWEAANPRSGAYYTQKRYQRSAFNQPGVGNYLKMSVAQGSPFVWCETNNNSFVNFYNLIRTNLVGQIDNNQLTGATTLSDGPYEVPGVTGVSFVLLYGNHLNPNQWYQEAIPYYSNIGDNPDINDQNPGGFNPPPVPYKTKGNSTITPPGQNNHTYTAIFFRTDSVKPVQLGKFGKNAGTDAQGNPYFYIEFLNPGKNWFVVGSVPEMRYYHTQVGQDPESGRKAAAMAWANTMGKYAFNFMTQSSIKYSVTNMYQTTTNHTFTLENPYVAAKAPQAASMTLPGETVLALNPHQYQPITLGPDLTKASQPQVVWNPLAKGYGTDFPVAASGIPNANKTNPTTPSRWGYWSLRGNLKAIITKGFSTVYPFQNFLPTMPAPDYSREITQTGIAGLNISNAGTGNTNVYPVPNVSIDGHGKGSGATFNALIDPLTGEVMQVDVVTRGSGYPVTPGPGDPTNTIVTITIEAPIGQGGRRATAYAQTSGDGEVLAVFMLDKGSGYAPVFKISQAGSTTDAPVITPNFDGSGNLVSGQANVQLGGAGFDFTKPFDVTYYGNGAVMPTVNLIKPGTLADVRILPFIGVPGRYPSTGTAPALTVNIPPPAPSTPAQTGSANMVHVQNDYLPVLVKRGGLYKSKPSASFLDDNGQTVALNVDFPNPPPTDGAQVTGIGNGAGAPVSSPKAVVFSGGDPVDPSQPAVGKVYPVYSMATTTPPVTLTGNLVGNYNSSVQVSFSGGAFSDSPGVTIPQLSVTIPSNGAIGKENITIVNGGSGLDFSPQFEIGGGRGFDAVLQPITSPVDTQTNTGGEILAVRVLRGGSNYLPQGSVYAFISDSSNQGSGAQLKVNIAGGVVTSVDVENGGQRYPSSIGIILVSKAPPYQVPPDPIYSNNPKGLPARFNTVLVNGTVTDFIPNGIPPDAPPPIKYVPGSWNTNLATSSPATIAWLAPAPFAVPTALAQGFAATPAPFATAVGQVLYSSIISQYTNLAVSSQAPFAGAFFGNTAPDGYGLGGQYGGAARFLGDVFNIQQTLGDAPGLTPSGYAVNAGTTPASAYPYPVFQGNNPYVTLDGGLKTTVQGLQHSLTQLFLNPPSQNKPAAESPNIWLQDYYSQYDDGVGRLVINPTGTQPVWGVLSSVQNPADIPEAENEFKKGLSAWQRGMLWSGFGVSDQWNDQHYFYGYYLTSAALAGIFDQSWEPGITSKPASLWVSPNQMGTAIEQMLLTLAYDPDNAALESVLYKNANFKYQKFAFFDQWTGHAWATGAQPGSTSAVLDFPGDPKGFWGSHGTLSEKYRDENENSIFEGAQAWSAAILWGGATDRKPVVDQGIYLYSTTIAAADAYFLDKNYNQSDSPENKFSWVPVTTISSDQVINNGNNSWPVNTSYATANPDAFYKAPEFFGDASGTEASPGQSLLRKSENTLNNFFYAYPTGSKFIQAYPPSAWTMGMVRNTNYMKKWAGAMMRQEWNDARNSALYQPADWIAMALTSALAGVPYNPGDVPYPLSGKTPVPNAVKPYAERLWSSWVTPNLPPGSAFSPTPPYLQTSILSFLLTLEQYGTPDWTYIGRATNAAGKDDNNSIVYTASFSKQLSPTQVQTTFVAFNPGWSTRYAIFQRLNPDGTINNAPVSGAKPLTIAPKKLVTVSQTFDVK